MNIREIKSKTSLDEMYVLKGIAIMGVIIVHMYIPLINNSINYLSVRIIAQFSMPIFMFASGYLFGYSKIEISSFSNYIDFIIKKFKRLMVPYFVISGVILLLKYLAAEHVPLTFPVDRDFWKYMLFNPVEGFAPFLWYLYVLFIIFLIFPVINKLLRNSVVLFLLIFIVKFIPIPQSFYINHVLIRTFLLFFCLGYLYSHSRFDKINLYSHYLFILSLALLVVLIIQEETIMTSMFKMFGHNNITSSLFRFLLVYLGLLTYYYLSIFIKKRRNYLFYVLKYLGMCSASIYLLHSISMGAVRVLLIDVIQLNEKLYYLISILIFISGIILPILITKYIINKFEILPPLILGVRRSS